MRSLPIATSLIVLAFACDSGLTDHEPPVLRVISPPRSLIQDHVGALMVTGTVAPNSQGTPVKTVMVNNVAATLDADGTFSASIDVRPGAMLINTQAIDDNGGKAEDTR